MNKIQSSTEYVLVLEKVSSSSSFSWQVLAQVYLEIRLRLILEVLLTNRRVQVRQVCLVVGQPQILVEVYLGEQRLEASLDSSKQHNVSFNTPK